MSKNKKIALAALLTALALGLSLLERAIPLNFLVPLPGIKLGLANVVTLFAIFVLGTPSAVVILLCRCVLTFFMSGSVTGLFMSLTGGFLALGAMVLGKIWYDRAFSLYGISIIGAAFHSLGQVLFACLLTGSMATVFYLPVLLLTAVPCGFLTAAVAKNVINRY